MIHSSPKSLLRRSYSEQRLSIPPDQAASAARAMADHFLSEPAFLKVKAVSGYMPIRGEMDVMPLLAALHARGVACALPVPDVNLRLLQFHRWQPGDSLSADHYGTPAPLAETPVLVPELVIVPLLAFDDRGHRLGYGGGYYDRTLAILRGHHPHLIAVGAGYASQRMDALPTGKHDQSLNYVITEEGILVI